MIPMSSAAATSAITTSGARAGRRGTLGPRRIPVPDGEPPYDDEFGVARLGSPTEQPVDGTLALAFDLPSGVPAIPDAPAIPARLRLVGGWDAAQDSHFAPQPTPRADLPDPRAWTPRLVQALVEVLGGLRPASQLVRWTSGEVYTAVTAQAAHAGKAAPRGRVRSVHVSEPADGVAEVCALVQRGPRAHAVALRLEGIDGRWQCTVFELR